MRIQTVAAEAGAPKHAEKILEIFLFLTITELNDRRNITVALEVK
jgi:hypothetical protein